MTTTPTGNALFFEGPYTGDPNDAMTKLLRIAFTKWHVTNDDYATKHKAYFSTNYPELTEQQLLDKATADRMWINNPQNTANIAFSLMMKVMGYRIAEQVIANGVTTVTLQPIQGGDTVQYSSDDPIITEPTPPATS